MAFTPTPLFTVLGKYVKAVNAMDTLITTYGATDTDLATIMNSQGYLDHYVDIPDTIGSIQNGVTTWINNMILSSKNAFLDRDEVLEELNLATYNFDTVLYAIHEYMLNNGDHVTPSVVTVAGSTGTGYTRLVPDGTSPVVTNPRVIVSDKLSATQSPKTGFLANPLYNNVQSQLPTPATITAKCTSAESLGSEVIQLTGTNQYTLPYKNFTENPGPGPSLVNAHNNSIVPTNWDFTSWTNQDPTGWTMGGGVSGTDWEKGTGPPEYLQINSNGVSAAQQVPAMSKGVMYMVGVYWKPVATTGTVQLNVKINDGTVISGNKAWDTTDFYDYGFYSIPTTSDATPTLTMTSALGASEDLIIYKVVIVPAVYYNGLAWAAWSGNTFNTGASPAAADTFDLDDLGTVAVLNGEQGVFQTYFRKAFKVQIPTDSVPSIADSLAT